MNKLFATLCLILVGAFFASSFAADSRSLPPYPVPKPPAEKSKSDTYDTYNKPRRLFTYARKENPRLKWDECLARKAYGRAKRMAQQDYFSHSDPKTGENPAWDLVIECHRCKFAGENLSKGYEPAQTIHKAWMKSRTHRKNIEDKRFTLLGVGCFDYICVQLFAGF